MPRHPKPRTKTEEELRDMAEVLTTSYLETIDVLNPRKKSKPMSNYASRLGHPCGFFHYAVRAHWEDMPTPDIVLRNIFGLGREHEHAIKVRLELDGWTVTKVETAFVDDELDIHGYMDFELSHPTKPGWEFPVLVEFKSTASRIYPSLTTFEGLFEHDKKWVRTAPYQVLKYAAMDCEMRPQVGVVYRCKGTGRIRVLLANTADHVHRLEECHERIRGVNAALEGKADPPTPIPYERMWCEDCDAAAVCPTMQAFSGDNIAKLIPEPAIIDTIAQVDAECGEKAKMKKEAWDDLKDQVAHYGGWKDLDKGCKRQVVGGRYRYECSVTKSGQQRLKVIAIDDPDAGVDEEV